jgi:hypothetical protein
MALNEMEDDMRSEMGEMWQEIASGHSLFFF